MSQPIYKVFLVKYTDAWFNLSPEEQNALGTRVGDALKAVGGERVSFCMIPGGAPWIGWGVEKYPDMDAIYKHSMLLFQIGWSRYSESETHLGMEIPSQ